MKAFYKHQQHGTSLRQLHATTIATHHYHQAVVKVRGQMGAQPPAPI